MSNARRGNMLGLTTLVIALAALTVAIFAVVYHREVGARRADVEQTDHDTAALIGLAAQATHNTLDPRYADANGDLVADAPANPADQIDPPTLTFSYVTTGDDERFRTDFKEVMAALSKATGKPVRYVAYDSVADKLRDVRDGKLSVCGVSTGSVPLAVCQAGFVPLVEIAGSDGATTAPMKLIVPTGSPLSSLTDLRGHRLTVTSADSNSGFKAPLVLLRQSGLLPPHDYGLSFSSGHTLSIAAIKNRSAEAAAVAGDVLAIEQAAGRIGPGDYKVIYTSEQSFPGAAIGCPNTLRPDLVAKIRQTLLDFNWTNTGLDRGNFSPTGTGGKFVPADYKKDWDYVRRIDESFGYTYALPPAKAVARSGGPTTR